MGVAAKRVEHPFKCLHWRQAARCTPGFADACCQPRSHGVRPGVYGAGRSDRCVVVPGLRTRSFVHYNGARGPRALASTRWHGVASEPGATLRPCLNVTNQPRDSRDLKGISTIVRGCVARHCTLYRCRPTSTLQRRHGPGRFARLRPD